MLTFPSTSLNLIKELRGRAWRKKSYETTLLVPGPVWCRSCVFAGGGVSSTAKDGTVTRKALNTSV